MQYSVRKQTQDDFFSRIRMVEKTYNKRVPYFRRRDRQGERPMFWSLVGFGWTYAALYVAFNRNSVELSVKGSALPAHLHDPALASLAAALSVSLIFLGYHMVRALVRARRYYNSGSVLAGFLAATIAYATPDSVYRGAYDMLDRDTKVALVATANKVRDVDWGEVIPVSSQGQPITLTFD